MQKIGLFLLFILCFQLSNAQYTELINSKRPGFSDSPYSVGTGVYQVEAGLFYKNIGNYLYYDQKTKESIRYKANSIGTDITLRTSHFFERLELDLDIAFVSESRDYLEPTVHQESVLGLSKLTFGAKYMVYSPKYTDKTKEIRSWKKRNSYDWKRLIPTVGVYAGINTNFLSKLHKNPDGISPRVAIYTQNDITNRFILLTNFISDKLFTDEAENSFIITATYTLTEKIAIFGESQGFLRKNVPNDFQYGAGGAYLLHKNLQVDASLRFINDERGDHTFLAGAGLSWRLDRHKDKFNMVDSEGKATKQKREGGGFFSRLFNRKNKKQRKVKKVKARKQKIKKLKPKMTKAQKRLEKEERKKAKEDAKNNKSSRSNKHKNTPKKSKQKTEQKKEKPKGYNKNYDPFKDDIDDSDD
ncbi:MAG TPA: hypothetical protein DDZ39_04315 [Flavobacteriaceae bacterium]|jgi:hypothetical protein|nr:hypothetical protein [Flavobacteriaceae bacterium]